MAESSPHGDVVYQICLYTLLVILFLLLGFRGSSEAILIACVAVPYGTLLLTWSCFRVRPAAAGKPRGGKESVILSASPAGHYLAGRLDRWLARRQIAEQSGGRPERGWLTYKNCYLVSVLLLLLLMGMLVPMALFRVSLNVERRLAIKQAQLHLASDLAQRWRRIVDQRENGQLSEAAWCEFQAKRLHDSPTTREPMVPDCSRAFGAAGRQTTRVWASGGGAGIVQRLVSPPPLFASQGLQRGLCGDVGSDSRPWQASGLGLGRIRNPGSLFGGTVPIRSRGPAR